MVRQRNSSVDLLRVLMMVGIMSLHIFAIPDLFGVFRHVLSLLLPCVVVFTFISGYYSIRFTWLKVIKLYGVTCWCLMIIWAFFRPDIQALVATFKNYWFLHAYAFLMFFAPLLNFAFDNLSPSNRVRVFLPILFVVFGWGFLANLAFTHHFIPCVAGLFDKSGLTLVGIYIVARFYRFYEGWFDGIPGICYGLAIPVLATVCTLGLGWFGWFNSPIAVVLALCVFHVVRRTRLPECVGRVVIGISPSVFSVYILHENEWSHAILHKGVEMVSLYIGTTLGAVFVISVLAFIVCMLVDVLRRIGLWILSR